MRELIKSLEEATKKNPQRMADYDWRDIAQMMSGKLISADKNVVRIYIDGWTYIFNDNDGEINISKETSFGSSVTYTNDGVGIGPATLAYRLLSTLYKQPIDYDKDLDSLRNYGSGAEAWKK